MKRHAPQVAHVAREHGQKERRPMPRGRPAVLIGTRPEAIKLAPVVRALQRLGTSPHVFATGQHAELLQTALDEYGIVPDHNLHLMTRNQSLAALSAGLLTGTAALLARYAPRVLIVQGDTSSALIGGLSAFYLGIPVAHVEAGLRSGDERNPFPEEMNRRLLAQLATVHFAPTRRARRMLLREHVPSSQIHVVGNTAVDALFYARDHLVPRLAPDPRLEGLRNNGERLLLVTAHRRESFGEDLRSLCAAIATLVRVSERLNVAFPVHPNPHVRPVVEQLLGRTPNVRLLPPLPHTRFVQLLGMAHAVITDSGGVQEEAAALGVPVLIVRRTTERHEALEAGVGELVAPDRDRLVRSARRLLDDQREHRRRAKPTVMFGDGQAAPRIASIIVREMLSGTAATGHMVRTPTGFTAVAAGNGNGTRVRPASPLQPASRRRTGRRVAASRQSGNLTRSRKSLRG